VTADTASCEPDTGAEVTIGELLASGERPLVWSLDPDLRMVARPIENVFPSGVKEVSGSASHPAGPSKRLPTIRSSPSTDGCPSRS